jgi:hypothetical protein
MSPIFDPNPERTAFLNRVRNFEDNFTERKPESVKADDIRKTVVAFANSVSHDRIGLLCIGVSDNGDILGVSNPDKFQKKLRQICDDCYPSIKYGVEVVPLDGKQVVVVEVGLSENRPHFSGPAYVRVGSESVRASEKIFEELIASQHDKAKVILRWTGKLVTVIAKRKKLGDTDYLGDNRYEEEHECTVEDCSPHYVRLCIQASGRYVSESIEKITIASDEKKRGRLMLLVEGDRA